MVQKSIGRKAGRYLAVGFSSLFTAVLLGSLPVQAASGPVLNVQVFPIANGGLPVTNGKALTYIYQIWNTGNTPVTAVTITDDKCAPVTYDAVGQDLNGDHKLDKGELWSYYCQIIVSGVTTNTVTVNGQVNGVAVNTATTTTIDPAHLPPPPPLPASVGAPNGVGANGGNSATGTGTNGGTGSNGTGGTSNGTNGSGGTNGAAGAAGSAAGSSGSVPKAMPNTGLGGGAGVDYSTVSTATQTATITIGAAPQKLLIPALGVHAKVQAVGLNADGSMGTPADAKSVAWYQYGAQPGQNGNAVLAGHVDTYTSANGVFAKLGKLRAGDDIYVTNAQKQKLHFKVNHTTTYSSDTAPLSAIFGTSNAAHLNLITCAGDWDNKTHRYTKRRVVFTDLVR